MFTPEQRAALAPFRTLLQTSEVKGWEHFDDVVFKVAAGGLALSVTFLGVTKSVAPASMAWVYSAWVCWTASLLVIMLSVITGQLGLRSQIRHIDNETYYDAKPPEGKWGRWTLPLNILGIVASGLGLVCLLMFAYTNL